jgi:hypothetical protein
MDQNLLKIFATLIALVAAATAAVPSATALDEDSNWQPPEEASPACRNALMETHEHLRANQEKYTAHDALLVVAEVASMACDWTYASSGSDGGGRSSRGGPT